MNDILLIGTDVEFSRKHKGEFERSFDKILKEFKMDQSKKKFLFVLQGVILTKTQSPTKVEDRKIMKVIPYASIIGSIKYAMLCTRPIVYLSMSFARRYESDPGVDHWIAVKVILSYLRGLRKYFSVMEVIKSYVDASFYTDPDDSKSQSGYILKVGAIS